MKKVIFWIAAVLLVCLTVPSASFSGQEARVNIAVQNGTPIRVHMFLDTTAMIMCYVTMKGQAMQCWQYNELTPEIQRKIDEMLIVYQKENKGVLPSVIVIPAK